MTKLFKLANHSTNNVHVEFDFDVNGCFQCARLVSYRSVILEIENDFSPDARVKVKCPVNYSSTTARHVNWFTTDFFGKNLYHELKITLVDGFLPVENSRYRFLDTVRWYNDNAEKFHY